MKNSHNNIFIGMLGKVAPSFAKDLDSWLAFFGEMEVKYHLSKETLLDIAKDMHNQKEDEIRLRGIDMKNYFAAIVKSRVREHQQQLRRERESGLTEEYLEY